MSKKKIAPLATAATIAPNHEGAKPQMIDQVKNSFDGLGRVVSKLPEGKDKATITKWVADTYLATTKTMLALVEGFASPAGANA